MVNDLFTLSMQLIGSFGGREGKWSGLHLLKSAETGKLGWFRDMVVFLAHIKSNTN
jgi:hypothetical protein